jgi:FKBP-type peptidyl-prolyl cis-trans isomerase
MIKQVVPVVALAAALVTFNACKPGFKKLGNGLEYAIIKDEKGDKKPKMGDIMELHIRLKADDSLLADSRKENNNIPVQTQLQESQFKGDWTNALTYLSEGDSAVVKVSIDSLKAFLKGQSQLPPFMDGRKQLIYEIKVVSVKTQQEMQEEQKKSAEKQDGEDDRIMQEYFTKNSISPTKTSSGLYYIMESEGTGANPMAGQAVTVNYTGRTLDGKPFDSNIDPAFGHTEPFTFVLGRGEVIHGWDQGVAMMKKGGKAKLYIPSSLAYGPQGREPMIPKNAILMFDVEVKDIAAAVNPQADASMQKPVQ